MSNKISFDEKIKSVNAVKNYLRHNGRSVLQKDVVVIKNGNLIISDRFNVMAFETNLYMRIDIMWEDAGYDNYRSLGLYGSYSTDYYQISYNNEILRINSVDNIEINIK